jgi:hypothetical protein
MSRLSLLAVVLVLAARAAAAPPTGFQPEVRVEAPTRLDWEFAASAFGADAARVPAGYDSGKQRYQLFVPRAYDPSRAWPLVVFVSPGDDPLGWRHWQKVCEDSDVLFCAAYAAGNNCPVGQRTRIVLDMFDDVRRHYRVDPDQTYLAGFSGGGRMACTIAFALPEYFGGVIPVCGTNPLPRLDYLRHRVRDRLAVAFVTGATDFNRKENEEYMAPLCRELDVRSRLWVVPKLGHSIPKPEVLAEVQAWLAEDLPRRRADAKARPGLAVGPDEVPTAAKQAAGLLEMAEAELRQPDRVWRGVALLQGVTARWGKSAAADRARRRLEEVQSDPKQAQRIAEQGGAEERQVLAAQARGLERLGDLRRALQAWELLAQQHADTPDGKKAVEEAGRLAGVLAATPYLGVAFAGDTPVLVEVRSKGPADRAGLKRGDRVLQVGTAKVGSARDVRQALQGHKPGDKVAVEVQRDGKAVSVTVELGAVPTQDDG